MKKSEIIEHLFAELGGMFNLSKGTLQHILKEYELTLLEGLEKDGEVSLLNFGKLQLVKAKPRKVRSPYLTEPVELAERNVLKFLPSKIVRDHVANDNYADLKKRVKVRRRPTL